MRAPRAWRWWLATGAYVALLFAMQPRLGFVVDALKARWGVPVFEQAMLAAVVIAGIGFLAIVWPVWRRARAADRVLLVAVVGLYILGVTFLEIPQERLHYVEYGVLAGLIYGGCREERVGVGGAVGIAILVTAALGYLDERLQDVWERRYFDWRDVQVNAQAAVLGTFAAVSVERASRPQG
jgi:VanZ family protein